MASNDTPSHPTQVIDFETFRQQQLSGEPLSVAPADGDMVPMMVWMPVCVMVPKAYAQSMPTQPGN